MLRPREGHDLRVERMHLDVAPACRLEWIRDVFGNSIALVDWLEPADTLTIVNDVVLERLSPFPTRELHEPWRVPFPPRYDPLEAAITAVYLQSVVSRRRARRADVAARRAAPPIRATPKGRCSRSASCVHATVKYQRRVEKGVQTPAQTLALGTGSCRDMATLMMEAARRPASPRVSPAATCTAPRRWPGTRRRTPGPRSTCRRSAGAGFDPTIGDVTATNHIVTGVSSHPRGVMPVSGTFTGEPGDYLGLQVTVKTTVLGYGRSA